jgi:hypothetical protein
MLWSELSDAMKMFDGIIVTPEAIARLLADQ